ncbi:MAG: DUF1467 family protein [Hyphomicrobiales bacterium]|nr:DUF1467 family protein [Hyphomicrobiales bacterium]MCP5372861.1 DUF1467 family protein [Hyphomicrobiales bacterium]
MGLATGAAVYVVVWWLVLFMVLPWGIRPIDAEDVAKGQAASAPRQPRIVTKMAITTVIAAVIWTIAYFVIEADLFTFHEPLNL